MKRIITLLLALTMVCTFLPIMASANSEVGYNFEIITNYEADPYDTFEEEGWFGLKISVYGDDISAGLVSFAYDANKLIPGVMGRRAFEEAVVAADAVELDFANGSVGNIVGDGYLDATNGIISFSYYINAKDVANENVIFTIGFAPVDEGATLDSLTDAIYPITKADSAAVEALYSASSVAAEYNGIGCSSTTGVYSAKNNNIVVNLGEEPEPDPVYTWGSATADEVTADETGVTGAKVAVFGKVSGGAGKVLADGEYWVTFGENTYLGKASTGAVTAWAIVIYDPEGKKVEAGRTYGYTAGMTGVESWTGSVTAAAAE